MKRIKIKSKDKFHLVHLIEGMHMSDSLPIDHEQLIDDSATEAAVPNVVSKVLPCPHIRDVIFQNFPNKWIHLLQKI